MTEGTAIQMVPVSAIHILNPRIRNKRLFQELVKSIQNIGLKKPISVSPRQGKPGYVLICGQGRLEAYIALGQTEIAAIVREETEEDCYIMSLAENLARRQPTPLELVKAINILKDRGYSPAETALKVDLSVEYVRVLYYMFENGEEKIINAMERGVIPHSIAMEIARAKDGEVQRALAHAYEERTIPGNQVLAIRKIIEQRNTSGKLMSLTDRVRKGGKPVTSDRLIRLFQRETERQQLMIKRAGLARNRLMFVVTALKRLLMDDQFRGLLEAGGLTSLPRPLVERMEAMR